MAPEASALMMILTAAAVLAAAALFLGAIAVDVLCLRRWRGAWRAAAALPLVALAIWAIVIVVSVLRDPTSHNLWPMELVLWGAGGLAYLGIVALARRLSRRRQRSPQ